MTEDGKQWVGQIVDGKFHLQQYLGGGEHSAVFLTERSEEPKKAAIKLVYAAPEDTERQLFQWRLATKLPHPHLLRIFETGQCQIGARSLVYVVTEYAEENLAEVLPQRVLTPEETRDLLKPMLDALAYLHSKGFVHGDLRPANILASADQLKLSTDSLCAAGISQPREADRYTAPEQQQGQVSPAADLWSLGMVLAEVLTGRTPAWDSAKPQEPAMPKEVPEPFAEIARRCLRLDPQTRWTVADIRSRLDPKPVAPQVRVAPAHKPVPSKWLYIVPSIVLALALVILLFPRNKQPASKKSPVAQTPATAKPNPAATSKRASAQTPRNRKPPQVPGAVLSQVLPKVPQSALDTITGRVRIAVRADVDESGNVVSTTLENAGPSKYFARLALQAAQDWKFTPPRSDSGPLPSKWVLRFTFTSAALDASAAPVR